MHSSVFLALADPTRRRILEVLRAGDQPVNDVVAAVDIHQSGVSRHLRILLEAGFVRVRPDGQRRLYSLAPEPFVELDGWMQQYREIYEARLDRFGEALSRMQKKRDEKRKEPK
jgi:DNA-binding transcriptional ArsR family regulator